MTEQPSIPVGYVRRAHGIRGDVLVRGLAADASDRFVVGAVLVTNEDQPRTLEVVERRDHKGDFMLMLDGIGDRTAAEALVGTQFVINAADRRTLDQDEWWIEDIVGCAAVDTNGVRIGEVSDVVVGASQDRLVVTMDAGGRAEIPLVDELVPEVDTTNRRVSIVLIDGLVE